MLMLFPPIVPLGGSAGSSVWSPFVSAGASLAGGFLQNTFLGQSQSDAQAFNAQEAEKNRQFQLMIWNKQNEYNTAANQRSRLEAAGLNPYLMMNGANAGVATGNPSGSAAASPGVPAYGNPMQGASDAILRYADVKKSLAEADAVTINNRTQLAENLLRMSNIFQDTQNKKEDTHLKSAQKEKTWFDRELSRILTYVEGGSADSRIESNVAQAAIDTELINQTRQVTAGIILDNATKDINLQYLEPEIQARIKNIWASSAQMYANAKYMNEQADFTNQENWWYHNPKGIRAHEINQVHWQTQFVKNQIKRLPANAQEVAKLGLENIRLQNSLLLHQSNQIEHNIFQGYWNSFNGTLNAIGNLKRVK